MARKLGSRMKVQERCSRGLSTLSLSQRRTVEAEFESVTARVTASRASSGHDQRESGAPDSVGNWQASALTSAICSAVNVGGRASNWGWAFRR